MDNKDEDPITIGQVKNLLMLLEKKGVDKNLLTEFFRSGLINDLFEAIPAGINREELRKVLNLEPFNIPIVIDYRLTIDQMIYLGNYGWSSSVMNKFVIRRKGDERVSRTPILYKFNKPHLGVDAGRSLVEKKFDLGTVEELLSYGAAFPEVQKRFPIVALGSTALISGGIYVHIILAAGDDSERRLDIERANTSFRKEVRFLVFPK